jgi:hypothetical protein
MVGDRQARAGAVGKPDREQVRPQPQPGDEATHAAAGGEELARHVALVERDRRHPAKRRCAELDLHERLSAGHEVRAGGQHRDRRRRVAGVLGMLRRRGGGRDGDGREREDD